MDHTTGKYFLETIKQGAFQRAIDKAEKIDVLLDHNEARNLGDTNSNLELREDEIGLKAHVVITDPEVIEKAKEQRLRGWSFGFSNPTEVRSEIDGMTYRDVTDLTLHEVSIIDDKMTPAYKTTSIEARAEGEIVEIRAEESEFEYLSVEADEPPEIEEKRAEKPNYDELKELINTIKSNSF